MPRTPPQLNDQPIERPRSSRKLLGLICLLALSCAPTAAADESQSAELRWANGDRMSGQLQSASPSRLVWQSSLFSEPFSLDLKRLLSVRFAQTSKLEQVEPLRFITHAGDVFYGDLVGMSGEDLLIASRRHGQISLPLAKIRAFRRLHDEGLIYLGPQGRDGWKTVSVQRRVAEWEAGAGGELTTKVLGAELFRDLQLPEISELELVLSWQRRPGFLITFADPASPRLSQETVRLETWEDELVLQTLAGNGNFEQLLTLKPDRKSVELRLLWNQRTGELAVYSDHRELLGKMSAGNETGRSHAGFYLKNKGSDLTLAKLRVSNWSGGSPAPTAGLQPSCVRLVDGQRVYGQIRGYEPSDQTLVVELPSALSRGVPLNRISSVAFPEPAAENTAKPPTVLSYYDGSLLRGTLQSVKDGTITLRTSFADEPVTARLAGARQLQFGTAAKTANDSTVLELGELKFHGRLAPAGPDNSQLGWQPVGSSNAAPVPTDRGIRIIRAAVDDEAAAGQGPDVVYLNTGDVLPCRVVSVDKKHLVIDSAFAKAARIPLGMATAVEFGADSQLPLAGFSGRRWNVVEKVRGTIERSESRVDFHGPGSLGHRDVLRGDEISFDMQWSATAPVAMTISFFTKDPKRSSAPSILVYCVQEQLFVRGIRGGHHLIQARRREVFHERRARLKFQLGKKLDVFVDQRKVLSQALVERDRAGRGVVLAVQRLDGGRRKRGKQDTAALLSISDFRVGRSAGPMGVLQVDQKQRDAVLTVPRNRKRSPPTHILIAKNGDLLRGRLSSLSATTARFQSRFEEFRFARDRLAGIIWLQQGEQQAPKLSQNGVATQVVFSSGATLTFAADKMVNDLVGGQHPILGPCRIPRVAIRELRVGIPDSQLAATAYADWELRPAKEPQFAAGTDSAAGAQQSLGLDSPLIGNMAADFRVALLDGEEFRLADHADKVVILDFWATWCGPCVRAMPQLIATANRFSPDRVQLVAVNQQEQPGRIREFLNARDWRVSVALDQDGQLGRQFQVEALPQTVIIGPGGKIERLHVGAHAEFQDELGAIVQQLLPADRPAAAQPPMDTE